MLLQTNSYVVPQEKRAAHNHLMQRFRQVLMKIGCDHFEVYEQVGANWAAGETSGRYVQMMRFRDRKHQQAVQLTERSHPEAQALVREFCELINFPYQEAQGLFAHGYYNAIIEPIRITRDSQLAFHSFPKDYDPLNPPTEPVPELEIPMNLRVPEGAPVDLIPIPEPEDGTQLDDRLDIRKKSIDAFSPTPPELEAEDDAQSESVEPVAEKKDEDSSEEKKD